jgi:protoporphyrin/coproporphyrin ferrochelatase
VNARQAVLLMAYGTPGRLEDVAEYFTHIRGGRRPSDDAIANLQDRYRAIGGTTPLAAITEAVRAGLERQLAADGHPEPVYVGMKHWHPYIADTMARMRDDGITHVTAVALAPHFSRLSVGAYRHAVEEANHALGTPFTVTFVDRWHDEAGFITMMADRVRAALGRLSARQRAASIVVFTAHSLPERIRQWNDPYERELRDSSAAVAEAVGLTDWRFAWQSAGGGSEPWIGPDILDYLETLAGQGYKFVVQVPIGFVSDHLEVLYDIDVEAVQTARVLGMGLIRTELPNASPDLIHVLASVVDHAERIVAR